jgi:putative hydrolase of the HAD superfamily
MSTMTVAERLDLVALLRGLSPPDPPVHQPVLRPDLAAMVAAPLPRPPRAILFDIYGTLVMSSAGGEPGLIVREDGAEAGAATGRLGAELEAAGFRGGPEGFARDMAGLIARERGRLLARKAHPEVDLEELAARLVAGKPAPTARRLALLLEASVNPCAPMAGAKDLLSRLVAMGKRLGLVSNAQFHTPILLEALFGAPPTGLGFEGALCAFSYQEGIAKPDEDLFRKAAGPLIASGMRPGEILVVGNSSDNDIAPARELGFMSALFAGDARSFRPSAPGSAGASPDTVIRALGDLTSLFPSPG